MDTLQSRITVFLDDKAPDLSLTKPGSAEFDDAMRRTAEVYQDGLRTGLVLAGELWRMLVAMLYHFEENKLYLYLEMPYNDLRMWAHHALLPYAQGKDEASRRDAINRMCHTVEHLLVPVGESHGSDAVMSMIEVTSIEVLKEQAGRFSRLEENSSRNEAVAILASGETGARINVQMRDLERADQEKRGAVKPFEIKHLYATLAADGTYSLSAQGLSMVDIAYLSRMSGTSYKITLVGESHDKTG